MAAVSGQAKPAPMTTERIQEMLEENFKFIKAIAEQQNLGRVQDVNQFQQKLQENLMLLAAVADTYAATPAPTAQATRLPVAPVPAAAPSAVAAAGLYPGGVAAQQQPMGMIMPGAPQGQQQQPGVQSAAVTQHIQAAVQQALVRQQQQLQLQQQQQQQQQFQLPQAAQQQVLGQQQGMGAVGVMGAPQPAQAAGGVQPGAGGFQLPAPTPLNLGM